MQHTSSQNRICTFRTWRGGQCCWNVALDGHEFCEYHLGPLTLENARDRVIQLIADELGFDFAEVSEQSRLVDNLEADSLNITEVIMRLEEELSLEIPDEEVGTLQSVGDFVKYVINYLQKDSPAIPPASTVTSVEGRKEQYTERILNRIIQSKLFRQYYEALELDEGEMVRLFQQVMGKRLIYHVTPVVVYKDDEKQEPECVHLFLLGKHNLFYFKLLRKSVKFEWAALKDLRLTYEVSLDDNKKISMISVTSSSGDIISHDVNHYSTNSVEVQCDSEESLHNVAFEFIGKEIEGALEFLDKYLTNLEDEHE